MTGRVVVTVLRRRHCHGSGAGNNVVPNHPGKRLSDDPLKPLVPVLIHVAESIARYGCCETTMLRSFLAGRQIGPDTAWAIEQLELWSRILTSVRQGDLRGIDG